jgi:hypothetical protein
MNGHTSGQPPFPQAWWSFDLGRYRGCDGTYCHFEYDSLPPIPAVSESLDWLEPLDERTDAKMAIHRNPPEARGEVAKIAESAARLGLTLPESFIRLMSAPDLQDQIPSCTACYFKLSDDIMPCPGSDGGYIVRFYNDQQDVFLWYLYLTPQGAQYVLVTPIELEEMAAKSLSDEERRSVQQNTWVCAPSFVAFIYRWWLENSLWFKVSESDDEEKLTADERSYLAHYDATNAHGGASQ